MPSGNYFNKISSYLHFPHPQACTTNGTKRLYANHLLADTENLFSASPNLRSSALRWCLSLKRALVLGQEALFKNVRFRGWGGNPRTLPVEERTVCIRKQTTQLFDFFYEESCFPSLLPERIDLCRLIGNSRFGLRNTGSYVCGPSPVSRSFPDCSRVSVLPLHNS